MGVIYKLTEDIVHFILEQKRASPDLSCRELVEQVGLKFGKVVSKSSVHDVLKHANITSPRGRKFKNKFQIPKEKKAQLLAQLLSFIEPPSPAPIVPVLPVKQDEQSSMTQAVVEPVILMPPPQAGPIKPIELVPEQLLEPPSEQATLLPDPTVKIKESKPLFLESIKSLEQGEIQDAMGGIFLKAAFLDIFPLPWGNVKGIDDLKLMDNNALRKELEYRSLMAGSFKVDLEDGCSFYVDCRFQGLSGQNNRPFPVPIEHALGEMADVLLNNLQPTIIKELTGETLNPAFYDFVGAFERKAGKNIANISLLDLKGDVLADFGGALSHERGFIIGISTQVIDIKELVDIDGMNIQSVHSYFFPQPLRFVAKGFSYPGGSLRSFTLLGANDDPKKVILSNVPVAVKDGDIVRMYSQRHPSMALKPPERLPQFHHNDAIEYFKEYAKAFFDHSFSDEMWKEALVCRGTTEHNNNIIITRLLLPNGYERISSFSHAAQMVNVLGVKDQDGRQIWIKIATENESVI